MIIKYLFGAYTLLLFIRIIASWMPQLAKYSWMQLVMKMTDPYLNIFRRFIPSLGGMDLSPIVAFLALTFIEKFVISLVYATY